MSLYNAKQTPNGILITKFTDDLDVEETAGKPASYIVSPDGCDCPAGHRDTCRHRQMLPRFLATRRADTPWFFDNDNGEWYYYSAEAAQLLKQPPRPSWRRI